MQDGGAFAYAQTATRLHDRRNPFAKSDAWKLRNLVSLTLRVLVLGHTCRHCN
jgi:hypothetical protein